MKADNDLITTYYCLEAKTHIHKLITSKEATLKEKWNRLSEIAFYLSDEMLKLEREISQLEKLLNTEILERCSDKKKFSDKYIDSHYKKFTE